MTSLHGPLVLARREVRDALTDWRVSLPMGTLTAIFPLLVAFGVAWGLPILDRLEGREVAARVLPFGLMVSAFVPISFSLVLALESFAGEKDRNTLEALLTTPLSDGQLFVGKMLAVLLPPVSLSLTAMAIFTLAVKLMTGRNIAADTLLLVGLLSSLEAVVMVAAAVVISTHAPSVRVANILASFIILPVAGLLQLEAVLFLLGQSLVLWLLAAGLGGVAAILVRTGIRVFNREEVVAREYRGLSLRQTLATFWSFIQAPPGDAVPAHLNGLPLPVRLYVYDLPQLLRLNRTPILVVAGLFVVGLAIGYLLGVQDPYGINWSRVRTAFQAGAGAGPLEIGFGTIFVHNLRAIAVTAVLSLFSFGTAALLLLMAPFVITGFIAGQVAAGGENPLLFLAAFILPHGLFEIPAAVLAGAFCLRLGLAIMAPPAGYTVGQSLLLSIANLLKAGLLLIPLFMAAAYVEANLTPQVIRWVYLGVR